MDPRRLEALELVQRPVQAAVEVGLVPGDLVQFVLFGHKPLPPVLIQLPLNRFEFIFLAMKLCPKVFGQVVEHLLAIDLGIVGNGLDRPTQIARGPPDAVKVVVVGELV